PCFASVYELIIITLVLRKPSTCVRTGGLVKLANASASRAHHEQVPIVLPVEPANFVDGKRSISRTDCQISKELELGRCEDTAVSLIKHVDVAVLTLDVGVTVTVDRGAIDAPLEAIRMLAVGDAVDRAVSIPVAVA